MQDKVWTREERDVWKIVLHHLRCWRGCCSVIVQAQVTPNPNKNHQFLPRARLLPWGKVVILNPMSWKNCCTLWLWAKYNWEKTYNKFSNICYLESLKLRLRGPTPRTKYWLQWVRLWPSPRRGCSKGWSKWRRLSKRPVDLTRWWIYNHCLFSPRFDYLRSSRCHH